MKIKRIEAGVYEFTNVAGFTGQILKQTEGGWTVFDPKTYTNLDFFMSKAEAKAYAENLENPEKVSANEELSDEELMKVDGWAWLDR